MKFLVVPHPCQHLVLSVLNFSHPGECEVVAHGGFKLNFLADWRGPVYLVASFTKCLFRCFAQFSLGFTCLICSSLPKSRRLFLITPCGNLNCFAVQIKIHSPLGICFLCNFVYLCVCNFFCGKGGYVSLLPNTIYSALIIKKVIFPP